MPKPIGRPHDTQVAVQRLSNCQWCCDLSRVFRMKKKGTTKRSLCISAIPIGSMYRLFASISVISTVKDYDLWLMTLHESSWLVYRAHYDDGLVESLHNWVVYSPLWSKLPRFWLLLKYLLRSYFTQARWIKCWCKRRGQFWWDFPLTTIVRWFPVGKCNFF